MTRLLLAVHIRRAPTRLPRSASSLIATAGGTPRAPDPTTIRLPMKPAWNLDPSDTDPLKDLDPVLRETLKRSFLDRMVAVRGAHLNLDNAFWSSPPPDNT